VITPAQLVAAGVEVDKAEIFAAPLQRACVRFHIDTPNNVAVFLANLVHESQGFKRLRENMHYTTPERVQAVYGRKRFPDLASAVPYLRQPEKLANFVYANRLGNGDVASGEGWLYRGAGLIMLTGQANFMAAESACGRPYKSQPHIVAQPDDAAFTSGWFWAAGGLRGPAEALNHLAVRKKVNGPAALGLAECADWCGRFLAVL
jgi:putative chitinase